MAETVKTEVTTAVPTAAAPNPEALMDRPQPAVPDQRFQNVDLEAQGGGVPTTSPPVTVAAPPAAALERSIITDMANSMDWGVANFLLAFCALVVMISASTICGGGVTVGGILLPGQTCSGITAYQVAVSTISAFFAIVFGLLYHLGKFTEKKQMEVVSAFQFLWWTAGVIVLTFFGSFQSTLYANGYFGSWGAFIFATVLLISTSAVFQHQVDAALHSVRKPLIFLVVASAVEMGASIAPCSPSQYCTGYNGFAVALGSISLFISLGLLVAAPKISNQVLRYIGMFLVLFWVIGFGIVTFGGPFVSTGNGYFASLAAVFASVGFLSMVTSQA